MESKTGNILTKTFSTAAGKATSALSNLRNGQSMKIFFMNSTGLAAWGGGEKWMLQTGIELSALGHRVFYGGRSGSLFLQKCQEAGFPAYSFKIGSDFDPLVIRKLANLMKELTIDVIITEQNKDIRLAGIAGKMNGKKLIIARNGLPAIKNNFRYRLLYPRLLDGILVTTQAIKYKYVGYQWLDYDFIKVIPNGLFPAPLPQECPSLIKKQYNIPNEKPVVGIFGKLIKQKQHNIFLEVAANLHKKRDDIIYLIVGDGPEREKIQKYAFELGVLDNLYMVGFQENPLPLYTACDLVLLTSQEEGLPGAVMEAMLMKKAVVAFDVGGVSELIISQKNGILIPPNDIYLMTKTVEKLLYEDELRKNIGNYARNYIMRNFTIDKMIHEFEYYLMDLLSKKRGEENGA